MPGVSGLLPDFETRMASMTRSPLLMSLRDLPQRASARIAAIVPHAMPDAVAQRLEELGFVPGETIRVVARGPFGREPIAVQVVSLPTRQTVSTVERDGAGNILSTVQI